MVKFLSTSGTRWLCVVALQVGTSMTWAQQDQHQRQDQETEPVYACSLSNRVSLHKSETVWMQEYINTDRRTFKMRIRYTEGNSWVGVGVNYDKEERMAPSYAVIGTMKEDGTSHVQRYWIDKSGEEGIVPIQDPNGHLKNSSFIQENGETFFEFEHDLVIMENGFITQEINSDSVWIYAIGPDNNDWGGRHKIHGSFVTTLSDNCVVRQVTDVPTAAPTITVTGEAEDGVDSSGNDATNTTLPIASDVPPLDQDGSDSTLVVPADDEDTTNTSDTSKTTALDDPVSSSTAAEETIEEGDEGNEIDSEQSMSTSSSSSQGLWVTHGLFMAFAWGLCAPLAMGATFFKNRFMFLKTNDRWFKIHIYLNIACAMLTILGFFLAVAATNKDGNTFQSGTAHNKVGLTIFLFILMQVLAGYFRPSSPDDPTKGDIIAVMPKIGNVKILNEMIDAEKPRPNTASNNNNNNENGLNCSTDPTETGNLDSSISHDKDSCPANHNMEIVMSDDDDDSWSLFTPPPPPPLPFPELTDNEQGGTDSPGDAGGMDDSNSNCNTFCRRITTYMKHVFGMASNTATTAITRTTRSQRRQMWKYGHRMMGVMLLGMAWSNCHTGIVLLCTKFFTEEKEEELINDFWGIVGTIACVYLFVGYIIRD
jgi:hypothetical protein